MGVQVIYPQQRQSQGNRQRFGSRQADHQRTGQPGRIGDRDAAQVAERDASPTKGRIDHGEDLLQMRLCRDLGNDSVVLFVQAILGRYDFAKYFELLINDSRRGFVASGFQCQDAPVGVRSGHFPGLKKRRPALQNRDSGYPV